MGNPRSAAGSAEGVEAGCWGPSGAALRGTEEVRSGLVVAEGHFCSLPEAGVATLLGQEAGAPERTGPGRGAGGRSGLVGAEGRGRRSPAQEAEAPVSRMEVVRQL